MRRFYGDTVSDMMANPLLRRFVDKLISTEIAPFIDMPEKEVLSFANSVKERFENPNIKHRLLAISLNSFSKFRVRDLVSVVEYYKQNGVAPDCLCLSLAALIRFYRGEWKDSRYIGTRGQDEYEINDSLENLLTVDEALRSDDVIRDILSNVSLWGIDLTQIYGMYEKVAKYYDDISEFGVEHAVEKVLGETD